MKIVLIRVLVFVAALFVSTFITWMSGWNFERGATGFTWALFSILFATVLSLFPKSMLE